MEPALSLLSSGSKEISFSNLDRVGRSGFLRLRFERHLDRTVLVERAFTLPLQVLEPIPLDGEASVLLWLLNPTGGLVGGDQLQTEVSIGPGAHACLTTPSATKVYRTLGPPACQNTVLVVEADGILEYLPEHVILHPESSFRQALEVYLESGSRAIIYDAFAVGRVARGERWRFNEFANHVAVQFNGKLLFHDQVELAPSRPMFSTLSELKGFGYHASLILISDTIKDWSEIISSMDQRLRQQSGVFGGATALSQHGCLVRFVTQKAHDCVEMTYGLWALSRRLLLGLDDVPVRKW